jgi:hypothetical protein
MTSEYFTPKEAQAKIGRRIQTLRAFSGVPEGTTGNVIESDRSGDGHSLAIRWYLPTEKREVQHGILGGEEVTYIRTGRRLVDWFSRDEYERYLREI